MPDKLSYHRTILGNLINTNIRFNINSGLVHTVHKPLHHFHTKMYRQFIQRLQEVYESDDDSHPWPLRGFQNKKVSLWFDAFVETLIQNERRLDSQAHPSR